MQEIDKPDVKSIGARPDSADVDRLVSKLFERLLELGRDVSLDLLFGHLQHILVSTNLAAAAAADNHLAITVDVTAIIDQLRVALLTPQDNRGCAHGVHS
ncbi:hypothetical protein [Chromobacterium violaceum]|uniref:hypothetical protein n=1 Tax=Chromobacterium violaceum TaxID=536 RepID=UPI0012D3172F|nr:hypothetical protein [Chromobacterium violaceum]